MQAPGILGFAFSFWLAAYSFSSSPCKLTYPRHNGLVFDF